MRLVKRWSVLGLVAAGLFLLLVDGVKAANTEYPPPPFLPPAGHPRVYFTSADLPRLRENVHAPQNARAWAVHQANLQSAVDGTLPPESAPGKGNQDSRVLAVIESLAFDHALTGDEAHGRRAVAALHNYLRTVRYPPKDYNNTGQTVFTIGAVYDWCYDLLTPDDRRTFADAVIATAEKMEIGWPPVKQGNVTGHGPEAQLQRDLMVAAVALYDERPDLYRLVAGRFFDRFLAPKHFMYPARMHTQGNHYTSYRFQWEMLATWLFARLGRPDVFGPDQRHVLDWMLYARRPDGQVLRDGDTHINNKRLGEYFTGPSRAFFLAANYFANPYYKMEAIRERPDLAPNEPTGNQSLNSTELLVFNDPQLEGRPLAELPLTQYFPSPKGGMIARTGWEDGLRSPSVVAEFKINEWYFANHQHLDAGAFQIYYRGMLATDSGYYQAGVNRTDTGLNEGSTGYGSLYDVNYNKRSIAHNTVTVFDPEERFVTTRWKDFAIANDGGQRFPNRWQEPREHEEMMDPANGYRIGTVLGHGFGPDAVRPAYSYLKGDLAQAYSAKIRAYERSFVFWNFEDAAHPAALVVFDRVVSANPAFRKAWLLHGLEEPAIEGARAVFKDTRPGYTGKLTVDTVLPRADDITTTKVGGPGRENWVNGTNYLALLQPDGLNEGGGWRMEVSPKTPRETDCFLHVLQVGDHTPDVPAWPVACVETATHAGVRVGPRVAVFAKARERTGATVEFETDGDGELGFLVADLEPGEWRIERNGAAAGTVQVTPEAGTAWWRGGAGRYRLTHTRHD